jgi:hypothetical protein
MTHTTTCDNLQRICAEVLSQSKIVPQFLEFVFLEVPYRERHLVILLV